MYVIKLENTVTHQIYQYEVNDNNEGRKLFYEFNVNTLELVDGEYLLTLYDEDGNVLSEDVLKIGDYKPNTLQYSKGDNTYIAIELDAKLGHKDAVVEDNITTIYPNDEYDGMTDVTVDAYPVYDRGRNDGYSDGYNAGNGDGYIKGSQDGYNQGYNKGYDDGDRNGYSNGYITGKYDAFETAKEITIRENGRYEEDGELYKVINVDVVPKINIKNNGLKFGYSSFTQVPEWVDFDGITDASFLFSNALIESVPYFDTSGVKNMTYMFNSSNVKTVPLFNTTNVNNMSYMFYSAQYLTEVPLFDTSNVTDMRSMFYKCKFTTLPPFDTRKVQSLQNFIDSCKDLQSLPQFDLRGMDGGYQPADFAGWGGTFDKLIDVGGFVNQKVSIVNQGWNKCPNLSYQSCINILNGLWDFVGNGETPNSSQGKLKVHQNFLNLVGDEISIGTSKGWTITA